MKKITLLLVAALLMPAMAFAKKENNAQKFFNELKKHCGNTYEGVAVAGGDEAPFKDAKLVMNVLSCKKNEIRIPFFVDEDKSRTWVLTLKGDKILLKHDHRHKDGTSDDVTMYGGITSNAGSPTMQVFPADQETTDMIAYAAPNVWWITVDGTSFTYNLRRMGTERFFSVKFDLTKPVKAHPGYPWGWKE
ncbi:cytochrome c556 [Elusimicrobium simillimum]|uniref:hypothetical protein n=1 Tax=Elusimicrobium simillimum TaxID=3143438 RepID=UPI003C6EE005